MRGFARAGSDGELMLEARVWVPCRGRDAAEGVAAGFVDEEHRRRAQEAELLGVREAVAMVPLDERHHTFLQALMRRGPLPDGESKKMHRELFGASDGSLLHPKSCPKLRKTKFKN